MAAQVGPLQPIKLPSGPSPITGEQRYWKTFRNQLLLPSVTSAAVTHISCPAGSTSGFLPLAPSTATSAAPTSNDLFAVTTGTRVNIYSIRTRKLEKTISRFGDIARSGEIRRDGRIVVAGEDSGRIQVFDIASRAILKTWTTHRQPVWATKFSPTELTTLLSASDDRTVRLWDLPSSEPTTTFTGHGDYVRCASFVPGTVANLVVSGSYDATVKLWDPRQGGVPVMTFKHAAPVEDVLPMPSGTTLLAAAENNISVLDIVAGRPLTQISNHQKTVTSLSLASGGRRVVSGGLDGHVKIFETTGWNVVSSLKYPSPILAVRVIGANDAPSTSASDLLSNNDRHLVVGMASGLLSIRTRLSTTETSKEKQREKEMAALVAGNADSLFARKEKRKRQASALKRLDLVGEGDHVVIANDEYRGRKKEQPWQRDLRRGRYAKALDQVLDSTSPQHTHVNVLTCLVALRHRSAMRFALQNRDETTVQPILRWISSHIVDPRYLSVCVEAGMILLELYAEYVGSSKDLHSQFTNLHRKVKAEVEGAQIACQTNGMLESLILGME